MKYNSCLLDRLYSTKCNYMQIHLLCDFLRISCTKKRKKKMLRIQKKLYILLYENRKYQSKMCTNSLYVTKNLQYKKTYENDQITHYLEHRGTGTGLITGQKQNLRGASTDELMSELLPHKSITGSNGFNVTYSWIKQGLQTTATVLQVTGSNKQTRSCSFSFEFWY